MASAGKFGSKWGSNCHKSNGQLLPHFQGVVTIQDDASIWWLPLPAPVWHFTQLVSQASQKPQINFSNLNQTIRMSFSSDENGVPPSAQRSKRPIVFSSPIRSSRKSKLSSPIVTRPITQTSLLQAAQDMLESTNHQTRAVTSFIEALNQSRDPRPTFHPAPPQPAPSTTTLTNVQTSIFVQPAQTWGDSRMNVDNQVNESLQLAKNKRELNQLREKPKPLPSGKPGNQGKSGLQQIQDNASKLLKDADRQQNEVAEHLGLGACLISNSEVHRGRPRKSIMLRNPGMEPVNIHSMAYHVTWCAHFGAIPEDVRLEYSHRCHNAKCIEPRHGIWERHHENSSRIECEKHGSHWILPNGVIVKLCRHTIPCLAAEVIGGWDDERIVRGPR